MASGEGNRHKGCQHLKRHKGDVMWCRRSELLEKRQPIGCLFVQWQVFLCAAGLHVTIILCGFIMGVWVWVGVRKTERWRHAQVVRDRTYAPDIQIREGIYL